MIKDIIRPTGWIRARNTSRVYARHVIAYFSFPLFDKSAPKAILDAPTPRVMLDRS